jgi:hypothetical protein
MLQAGVGLRSFSVHVFMSFGLAEWYQLVPWQ